MSRNSTSVKQPGQEHSLHFSVDDNLRQSVQDAIMNDVNSLFSLINSSEDPIWFVDCDKRILLANDAIRAIVRGSRGIAIVSGMTSCDFLPADEAAYFDQIFEAVLRGKTLRLNHTAPDQKEYAATIQPVKKDGKIIGASVFARDITKVQKLQKELLQFEHIIASTPDLIALVDKDHNYLIANAAYLEAFDVKKDEIQGLSLKALQCKQHYEDCTEPNLKKALSGQTVKYDCWLDLPTRGRRFLSITYHPLNSQDLKPEHIVINAHDITERKLAEDERRRIFDVSLDMLAVTTFEDSFIEINPAWTKTLGWSEEELKEKRWLDLVIEPDRESSRAVIERLRRGESVIGFENRCLCKDDTFRWISWSSSPDPEQQLIYTTGRDITSRRRMEDELRQLATTDPLTGANNRRHFIEQAAAELKRSKRYGTQMAILMLDIDHFKRINDSHGHSIGDEVLKRIVDSCHQELRSSDIFGRLGGEEFAAVLVESNQQAAQQTCQRLLETIAKLKIRTPSGQVSVTASIGLTMHSADDLSVDPLLKRADDALYKAKNSGRNRVVCN